MVMIRVIVKVRYIIKDEVTIEEQGDQIECLGNNHGVRVRLQVKVSFRIIDVVNKMIKFGKRVTVSMRAKRGLD